MSIRCWSPAKTCPWEPPSTKARLVGKPGPRRTLNDLMITKSADANAMQDVKGSMTRVGFLRGEPIRRDKLVKADAGGFMSAILPSGMRAVAIKIDNSGDFSAGGFILPDDRVDVVSLMRDDEATKIARRRSSHFANHSDQRPRARDWAERRGAEWQESRDRRQRHPGVGPRPGQPDHSRPAFGQRERSISSSAAWRTAQAQRKRFSVGQRAT